MDKNAIKKYAVWARRELIARVSQRAALYEITPDKFGNPDAFSVHGRILSAEERSQRKALITKIQEKNYERVMEEVAYTWFNRFSALRFMEVNGYLPSHVRVFTDDENNFKPQIMTEAINLELDGLDLQKVYEYKNANDNEALFKYLIITQCNALSSILPGMFQKISDYTELLFPDNLLREGSVVERLVSMIPEEDWTDQVQIIGWLYQYYNTEPKDQVFANLKKNIKISKENIPAATQLFTPDWIVRYMVENSLGRLWVEGHPNDELKTKWKYYLEEAEQEPEVKEQLKEIRKEYATLNPEEIRCIDPCMGSGHILVYMFDVLMQIYEESGYNSREAAVSIVKNNLWGLDIDDRAAQLSYFSVMMKARQFDGRFFNRGIQPHVYAIYESNSLVESYKYALKEFINNEVHQKTLNYLLDIFMDAKEYGSILNIEDRDYTGLRIAWENTAEQTTGSLNSSLWYATGSFEILHLIDQAIALSQKYHIVITNPPYMGSTGMDDKLTRFLKLHYPNTKSDMSTVNMEKALTLCTDSGFVAMINIPVWMFLTSYKNLRNELVNNYTYINMVHPGRGIFGSDFGTITFVICKKHINNYTGRYHRLFDKQGGVETSEAREDSFIAGKGIYFAQQKNFKTIPGEPVAYWASKNIYRSYEYPPVGEFIVPRHGLATSDNNRFLKLWFEIDINKGSIIKRCDYTKKWFPMNKGGSYRKWYGNLEWVINYEHDGLEIKEFATKLYKSASRTIQNTQFYFMEGITWSALTSGALSFRWSDVGAIFGSGAHCAFAKDKDTLFYGLALLNGKVSEAFLGIVSPTLNTNVDDIRATPYIEKNKEDVTKLVWDCIAISRKDWDSFEASWDFSSHPLVQLPLKYCCSTNNEYQSNERGKTALLLSNIFNYWEQDCNQRFAKLKKNEEELNRIFIDIYGLENELMPNVADKDITVRKADLQRDVRSLISYTVGCMFGRYSLDVPGLVYAGGEWDSTKYKTFEADSDAIIPICDDEYFNDDIVGRFVKFVEVVYGKDTLEENLKFIADALGGTGTSREIIRNYFINGFYADHLKVYQKRPIYWLFDSGKKNGFKCLVYMHRYQPDTIARIRTDYVHEQQSRYRTAMADLQNRIDNAVSTSERVKLSKKLKAVQEQDEELRIYEEKIHHLADQMISIDLDDGVKVNYAKFQDVLAKIK